jgi:hypothetical protein
LGVLFLLTPTAHAILAGGEFDLPAARLPPGLYSGADTAAGQNVSLTPLTLTADRQSIILVEPLIVYHSIGEFRPDT